MESKTLRQLKYEGDHSCMYNQAKKYSSQNPNHPLHSTISHLMPSHFTNPIHPDELEGVSLTLSPNHIPPNLLNRPMTISESFPNTSVSEAFHNSPDPYRVALSYFEQIVKLQSDVNHLYYLIALLIDEFKKNNT